NNPTLPGAFRVRDTGIFRLYRKIDVHAGSRSTVMVELMGLPIQQIQNWDGEMEAAIKLSDLVQGIASYDSLKIVCWDGYGADKFYQPEWIAGGYYLLGSEVTIFPGINLPNNQRKMKKVSFIEVSGATSAQNHVFELAPNSSANLSFDLPNDLSPYIKTHLVDFGSK
ncbi:MAG: hypothetical protein U1C33_01680, partial [Candidatus Cloacimonadaceae bacterium]|nr:hypothetical protein [Candidatus Cloacimonadaceae bacterium]